MRSARIRWLVVLSLVLSAVALPAAQERIVIQQGPVGDLPIPGMPGARPVKTGTGRITGRVVAAETGQPIRRAQVRVMSPDIGAKSSLTDADGRYEFRDLPAGRFTLNASKSGFVNVQYGQTRPFESGKPIELADKQVLDKADISMPRGSVISGRIVDEFGEPVADATVTAMRQTWANGRRRLVPAGRFGQTNDLGQYRMYGLPPGDYYVSATLRNMESMVFEAMGASGGPTGSNPGSGYTATYFPGTASPAEAQKIHVALGQEAQQTDFALLPVRLTRITGTVVASDGKPVENGAISLMPQNRSGDLGMMMMTASARTAKDGQFVINGVPPGDYMLNARVMRMTTPDGGASVMYTFGGPGGENSEFAIMPLSVSGEELSNVMVVTSKGATATGRVSFEGGAKPPALGGIRIMVLAADAADGQISIGGTGAATKEDGSFELRGLSGPKLIRAFNLPQGWMLKAVRVNGNEATDTGTEFKTGEPPASIELIATAKVTEVNGGVTSSTGTAVKDYTAIVFSDDPQQWTLPMSRWVSSARPDQDGAFKIRNLPAGSYYAAAVDYVEAGGWGDPDLLDRLKTSAHRFTLADGETKTLNLKIVP